MPTKVLIAGGGVAALEAALALRELAAERVDVELVAPQTDFWYRALAVGEPFGRGSAMRYDLPELAAAAGASFSLGTVVAVDAERHVVRTAARDELHYDALVLALGADPRPVVDGALTYRGPRETQALRELLDEAERGHVRHVVFAVPWGAVWALPLYELALMTAAELSGRGAATQVSVVTREEEPLELFGPAAGDAMRGLLADHDVALHTSSYPIGLVEGELRLVPRGAIVCDRVVALPRLHGVRIDGIPQTAAGFITVDDHCRVVGVPDVYAAGDITSFPVKQGGIAAQQADAVAESIAAVAGAPLTPAPFRPVLRGLLLTGARPRYLRHDLGRPGASWTVSDEPLWWPPAKIVGRYFAPFFAQLAAAEPGHEPVGEAPTEREGALAVEVELVDEQLSRLAGVAAPRFEDDADDDVPKRARAEQLMDRDPVTAEPEDTLGELAERMRAHDAGSALVVDHGRLIGIVTSRDLLRAFAGRVHPSEARVREWMTSEPVVVEPQATTETAALLMSEHGLHHLPVVEHGRPVGLLAMRAVARYGLLHSHGAPVGLGF